MKITRKHIFLVGLGVILFIVGYQRGYEKPASEIGIARVEFVVLDATTGMPVELFDYSSPVASTQNPYCGAFTLTNGKEFNSFYAISNTPLTFTVSEDGYEHKQVEVPLATMMNANRDGHHGTEIVTIKLRPQAEPQNVAGQSASAP